MAGKMMCQKNAPIFIFLFILTEVASWTIDLPEVRKHLFAKNNEIHRIKDEYKEYVHSDDGFYSNIQGNSMHNSEDHEHDNRFDHGYYDHYLNSKDENTHSLDGYEHGKLDEAFGYHSYMERKVQEIVHDGSMYLEGLRRALEEYSRFLKDCSRRNSTAYQNSTASDSTWNPRTPTSSSNMTMRINSTDNRFSNMSISDMTMSTYGFNYTERRTNTRRNRTREGSHHNMTCREALEVSENVRRYADLAMWATRRLQDISYAKHYQKTDKYEENELILKLAWFLDQLAALTGYEPDYKNYLPEITTAAPTSTMATGTLVPQTEDLKNFLINCLKTNSSEPATERCRYPLPLPDMISRMVEDRGTSISSPQDNIPQQSMELLITADDFRTPRKISKRSPTPEEYFVPIPIHEHHIHEHHEHEHHDHHEHHEKPKQIVDFIVKKLTNLKSIVKSVKKHAVADFASQIAHKHVHHKRSIDDNTSILLNRLSNNSKPSKREEPAIEMASSIPLPVLEASIVNTKSFKKRSIDDSGSLELSNSNSAVKSNINTSVRDPFSKLAKYYIKYKVWENSNPSHENNEVLTNFDVNNNIKTKNLNRRSIFHKKNRHFQIFKPKLHHKSKYYSGKKGKAKLLSYFGNIYEKKHKKFVKSPHKIYKRSLLYEHMYLPRISEDPTGDRSYYVKKKEGTDYKPSLLQAAQVRLGLQQMFETGNIEVIHRYGSNFNPANPAPFYTGVFKGMADS